MSALLRIVLIPLVLSAGLEVSVAAANESILHIPRWLPAFRVALNSPEGSRTWLLMVKEWSKGARSIARAIAHDAHEGDSEDKWATPRRQLDRLEAIHAELTGELEQIIELNIVRAHIFLRIMRLEGWESLEDDYKLVAPNLYEIQVALRDALRTFSARQVEIGR